jgi:hypothetical protein
MEVLNMDPGVKAELKKLISAKLCSSVVGQVCKLLFTLYAKTFFIYSLFEPKACMAAIVNEPNENEPSYNLFIQVLYGLQENDKIPD